MLYILTSDGTKQTWGQFNSGIDYLKKLELELKKFELELKFPTINNTQINLPFNFLIQKYFFRDNPDWSIYSW